MARLGLDMPNTTTQYTQTNSTKEDDTGIFIYITENFMLPEQQASAPSCQNRQFSSSGTPGPRAGIKPRTWIPRPAGPMDCRTACLHFSGVKPPRADAEDDGPPSEKDQAKEIIAWSGVPIMTPNGGAKAKTISLMSLKSIPAINQEPTQGRGTGLQPGPMTTTLEQDNQVAKLGFSANEKTPRLSTTLLPLDPSTQFPRPCLSQCPDDPPPWKMLSLEVRCYIDPRTLHSKLIAIFE
ncbi:hypothetical protein DSO57_1024842 [Entomophthora muscae]|uniref:Uncharacterized protein n=1 Tax=Entomophthora muscae TaxID=34485 RepID=A0ACC2UNB1_9FUNG|nr:hypothetical protein DSO57_1024842 [Entomophthora muscae]